MPDGRDLFLQENPVKNIFTMSISSLTQFFSLQGRRAFVTGSSRGIGRAIALRLAQAGAEVTLHGTTPSAALEEACKLAGEAAGSNTPAPAVTADLGDSGALGKVLDTMEHQDILVLNASVQRYMYIDDFEYDEFQREMAVNVGATCQIIQHFLPAMRDNGFGRIISIGSVNQWKQAARLFCYSATKTAQLTVIESIAREYAPYGITANNVAPGVIITDRTSGVLQKPELCEKLIASIPQRRFGEPDEISGTVLLLASPAGSYINGADIPITGGMHM